MNSPNTDLAIEETDFAKQGGRQEERVGEMRRSVFAVSLALPTYDSVQVEKLTVKARKLHIVLGRLAGQQWQKLKPEERLQVENDLRTYIAQFRKAEAPTDACLVTTPHFFCSLRELADQIGSDPEDARHLRATLEKLATTVVRFNALGHSAEAKEKEVYADDMPVVSPLLLLGGSNRRRGYISWSYHPLIFSIMVQPRTYAWLNLTLVRNARTYTALALYEHCRRFINRNPKEAGPYPIEEWQRLLTENNRRPVWEDRYEFIRRIKRAIGELRVLEGVDFTIEYKLVRSNDPDDKKQGLKFILSPIDQPQLPFGAALQLNRPLVQRFESLGFKTAEINAVLDERGEEYLLAKLAILDKQSATPRGVDNPEGFIRRAIEADYKDEELERQLEAKRNRLRAEKERQAQQVREAFAEHQQARIRKLWKEADEALRAKFEREFHSTFEPPVFNLGERAQSARFFSWLVNQPHGLFTELEDTDLVAFSMQYAAEAQMQAAAQRKRVPPSNNA